MVDAESNPSRVRRGLVLVAAVAGLALLGGWWLTARASARDVTIRLTAPACRAQRLSNLKPETRIELVELEGGRCEIGHVDVEEWTEDPGEFVTFKSHGSEAFRRVCTK